MNFIKIVVFISLYFISLQAHPYYIYGKITKFTENGVVYTVKQETIYLQKDGKKLPATTDNEGRFHLNFAPQGKPLLKAGEMVRLQMDLPDKWFMLSPYNGVMYLPKDFKNANISVKLLANKSKIKTEYFTISANNGKREKAYPVIQVGAFDKPKNAKNILRGLRQKHYHKAFIKKIGSKYKVFISVFKTKSKAKDFFKFFRRKYKKEYPNAFVTLIAL